MQVSERLVTGFLKLIIINSLFGTGEVKFGGWGCGRGSGSEVSDPGRESHVFRLGRDNLALITVEPGDQYEVSQCMQTWTRHWLWSMLVLKEVKSTKQQHILLQLLPSGEGFENGEPNCPSRQLIVQRPRIGSEACREIPIPTFSSSTKILRRQRRRAVSK